MPEVSIIIPCLNEYRTIRGLLQAVYEQSYPRQQIEVVIADGLSTDGTREQIATFASQHPDLPIQVVDNPARVIPVGLNRALEAARGEFVVRLDAHSQPRQDYVERVVEALGYPAGRRKLGSSRHRGCRGPSLGSGRRPLSLCG
jgi:succinoglycan biosynthesis protein ExoA